MIPRGQLHLQLLEYLFYLDISEVLEILEIVAPVELKSVLGAGAAINTCLCGKSQMDLEEYCHDMLFCRCNEFNKDSVVLGKKFVCCCLLRSIIMSK